MCGIVAYTGEQEAAAILLEGLRALEYRGYDSAGIAVLDAEGGLTLAKREGKLTNLVTTLGGGLPSGTTGIGHTRWATHGRPSDTNAHPHCDCSGSLVVIQNGIVENYAALKAELLGRGHAFQSETDTETIAHLMEEQIGEGADLGEALRRTLRRLEGSHAIVALSRSEPGTVVAGRLGNAGGVVVGFAPGETFLASDLPALVPYTRDVAFLRHGEVVKASRGRAAFMNLDGQVVAPHRRQVAYDPIAAHKGTHRHFMLKEILEQPVALSDTIRSLATLQPAAVHLTDVPNDAALLAGVQRVVLVGMGSSLNGAMVGKRYIERLAGLPCEVENASEYRYASPPIDAGTLVIGVTQSGESVETLEAMKLARDGGATVLTVTNIEGSAASLLADGAVFLRCGLEVGVASTKSLTATMAALLLLAARLGELRGRLDGERLGGLLEDLARLPNLVGEALARQPEVAAAAHQFAASKNFLFLGRGLQHPIAMEGALKLKEISYLHAEGYAAGEMKHGPIALIDQDFPTMAIALQDSLRDKMASNIQQLKAREGVVAALLTDGDSALAAEVDVPIYLPPCPELTAPILATVPLQLFAYEIAVKLGFDVDQPRNLAKTVTVE
jgi:glucosamine--fructose-6-phosphate aminotransferase (isomerizing)